MASCWRCLDHVEVSDLGLCHDCRDLLRSEAPLPPPRHVVEETIGDDMLQRLE